MRVFSTPFEAYRGAKGSPEKARAFGASLGALFADQHTCIREPDAAGLRRAVPWPLSSNAIRDALARVVLDRALRARCEEVIAMSEAIRVAPGERALVHGDLAFHNSVLDPSFRVTGVYDYDGAAWADRHYDFRYLVFDVTGSPLDHILDAALDVYEPIAGVELSRPRIHLYNAASAVSFLAFRDGHTPEERWCGRTLAEDLGWTRHALSRV